jgi:hydroxylamine dehydrogenase
MRKRPTLKTKLLIIVLVMGVAPLAAMAQQANFPVVKEYRIERSIPPEAVACIECHKSTTPGIFADWAKSRHANANISCLDCHLIQPGDKDVAKGHDQYYSRSDLPYGKAKFKVPIASIVTPKDCSRCHPDEATQYDRSKHANTLEIIWKLDPWLNKGMNSDNERKTGCFNCHGTIIKIDEAGDIDPTTWPNAGVGRINVDGSKGSCTSCHTRHRFSIAEARMPEACDQCHLGPDHPQIEIFEESKHGTVYNAYKDEYNFDAAGGTWTPGVDYRAPTCAACHMSGSGKVLTSHDVTERLSWETQAPLTVRPENFKPFPAKSDWKTERAKMQNVCRQCHGDSWINDFYDGFDTAVTEYNEVYFKPAKAKLDELYSKNLLDKTRFFDEHLELQFYELWHHEGRRARMGAMMMAPDYSWWHGFYECKSRFNEFMEEAEHLTKTGKKAYVYPTYPNATGNTKRPVEIFGKK